MADTVSPFFDTQAAAQYVGLSPATLEADRTTRRLEIPYAKLGRRVVYRRTDLDAWVASKLVQR